MAEGAAGHIDLRHRTTGRIDVLMLAYLLLLLVQPVAMRVNGRTWAITLAGMAAAVVLVLRGRYATGWKRPAVVAALAVLGALFAPINWCGFLYFVFAATLVGRLVPSRRAAAGLLALVAFVTIVGRLAGVPLVQQLPALLCTVVAGVVAISVSQKQGVYVQLLQAQAEVKRLAEVAERERIARDLHDVLGHTLSVIILKSELAARLALRDPQQAQGEMQEVERIGRQALSEIRHAIRGYRAQGLPAELERARQTLATAGIAAECRGEGDAHLDAARETVLALVLREAVTNVVRHAGARHCRVELGLEAGHCRLEVTDDGRGAQGGEGNGLRGMRERVEALGGTLTLDGRQGTRLSVRVPVGEGAR
jgi:two-component system, NarL family, sensor histidine kinase DesK